VVLFLAVGTVTLVTVLFIHRQYCSHGTVHPPPILFTQYCSSAVGSLPRVVTMLDDTEVAALRTQLKAIIRKAEDTEAQAAAAAHRRVQPTRLLLEEEESKAAALEQTATAARQHVSSSSSS
jgi:hypothetical protein